MVQRKYRDRWRWVEPVNRYITRSLDRAVSIVRGTPVNNLQDHQSNVAKEYNDGDGVESNTREPALFKVLTEENEHQLRFLPFIGNVDKRIGEEQYGWGIQGQWEKGEDDSDGQKREIWAKLKPHKPTHRIFGFLDRTLTRQAKIISKA